MVRDRRVVPDSEPFRQFSDELTVERLAVVGLDFFGTAVSTDDVLKDETCYRRRSDIVGYTCFWPFGEVIYSHDDVAHASCCGRKGSFDVDTPSFEGTTRWDWVHLL